MLVTGPAYGGFCMNENSLGLISLSTSSLMIPWSLIVLPILLAKLGVKWCIRALMVVYTGPLSYLLCRYGPRIIREEFLREKPSDWKQTTRM